MGYGGRKGVLNPPKNEPRRLGGCDSADSFEGLRAVLEREGFELTERQPMPLLIRETARKYQYIVADGTMWTRLPDTDSD